MIIYVEDDLTVADLWAFELQEAGYKVITLRTPDEVLDRLKDIPTDLKAIIVDIMLPLGTSIDAVEGQSGLRTGLVLIEKIRQICKEKLGKWIPIIVVTIRNTYKDELESMGIPVVSKRKHSPRKVLEILREKGIPPDKKVER